MTSQFDVNEMSSGEKKEAIEKLEKTIQRLVKADLNDPIKINNLIDLRISLGYLYSEFQEHYKEAIAQFLKAIELLKEDEENRKRIASLKGSMASVYFAMRDFEMAMYFYRDSLELLDEKDIAERMISEKGLGISLMNLGFDKKGIEHLLQSLNLCVEQSDIQNYMDIISVLKRYYSDHDEWGLVIDLEEKALEILKKLNKPIEVAISHLEIGLALSKLEKYGDAMPHFKLAVNNALKKGSNKIIYQGILMVAETYIHLKKKEEAIKEYKKALSMSSYMNNHEEIQKNRIILSTLGVNKEQIENAIKKGKSKNKN
ncbi:MAG: hypothetical protein GF364_21610 [Candidatus Lokiarchaeota archaeon]|nr:hypothetical protein [Candidatus Lokiarchaeota archaeon]